MFDNGRQSWAGLASAQWSAHSVVPACDVLPHVLQLTPGTSYLPQAARGVLYCAGEVVVFNINGRDIPIVHRVIKVHERANENHLDILTKVSSKEVRVEHK